MFEDVSQRELDMELLRDRLRNTDPSRKEWCGVFCEYIARLARKD